MGQGELNAGEVALQMIRDHTKDCADYRKATKDSLDKLGERQVQFLITVLILVLGFAGYEYKRNEDATAERMKVIQTVQSTSATTQQTVKQAAQQVASQVAP
jgi:hypothetical protein